VKPIRILIADDHEMVRNGLRTVLTAHDAGWTICGEAADGRRALELVATLRPHVAIIDITMPELNGLEVTRRIRAQHPETKVVVLTMHDSEQVMHEVIEAGAAGFVLKSDAGKALVTAIARVIAGKTYFTAAAEALLLRACRGPGAGGPRERAHPATLTPREREVLQLIAEGRSTKQVAYELGVSFKTADTHRTNLMRKLNLHSVSEIVRYAIRNKLVEA